MEKQPTDIELFKILYYHEGNVFENEIVIDDVVVQHGFTEQKADYMRKKFLFKKGCRHCGKEILPDDFSSVASYWNNGFFGSSIYACHKECVNEQKKYEAYECQNIDRDCNDCAFFKRGKVRAELTQSHNFILGARVRLVWKEPREINGKIKYLTQSRQAKVGDTVTFNGYCEKRKIETIAVPQFASGYECFVHRRDAK